MRSITPLLALLLAMAMQALAQAPAGNPALPARLELSYGDMKHLARMDGQNLDPGTEMKLVQEFGHGKHVVEILAVKGLFKVEAVGETILDLPGGYLTRARLKDGVLQVIDTIPLAGTAAVSGSGTGCGARDPGDHHHGHHHHRLRARRPDPDRECGHGRARHAGPGGDDERQRPGGKLQRADP
jgi:hypothetical protein